MYRLTHLKLVSFFVVLLGLCLIPVMSMARGRFSITLFQAEQAAIAQSPELKSLHATSRALSQAAIAARQFADPKLMLGTMNVPVDTFNFNQEAMTQVMVGVVQAFPKGHSLRYRSLQQQDKSQAEYEKAQTTRIQILHNVRISWLNLYYWLHAKRLVYAQKRVFRHLVKVAESMLANNKAQQKDVIRAQLELTDLDNQLIEINQQITISHAQLARWVGVSLAKRAYPNRLPNWKNPPSLVTLLQIIKRHPKLRTDQALIAASHAGVKVAEQQYVPGFKVGVAYGFRGGRNFDGSKRSDFLTAQLSIDLPLFTRNRQSRRLKASEDYLLASEENQISHYRQLRKVLKTQYTTWQAQRKSAWLYRWHLIPEAKQYAEATRTAYQNIKTDFPTLARAYVRDLNTRLASLKVTVNRDIARINLLYLQGK